MRFRVARFARNIITDMDRNKMMSLLEEMAEELDNRDTLSEFEAEWLEQVQTQNPE